MKPTVVSLFSGCGGLDYGFHEMGYQIIWANDILNDACETYKTNFNLPIDNRDLLDIKPEEIPESDLIIGGPPCQSFSLLGKRDVNDKRAKLASTYLDILAEKKPNVFLFENVTGFKSAKNQLGNKVIDDFSTFVKGIGYSIGIFTLNAADYGVPQKRRRVFIVGFLEKKRIKKPYPSHSEYQLKSPDGSTKEKWISVYKALSDLPEPSLQEVQYSTPPQSLYQKEMRNTSNSITLHFPPYSSDKDMEIIKSVPPGGNYMDVPDEIATTRILNFKKTGGRTTTYGRLHPDKPAYTINTHFNRPNVGCNIHYRHDRLITIREALRLQSFPDKFKLISSNKRNYYVQVGNAVPPLLSRAWAKLLLDYF